MQFLALVIYIYIFFFRSHEIWVENCWRSWEMIYEMKWFLFARWLVKAMISCSFRRRFLLMWNCIIICTKLQPITNRFGTGAQNASPKSKCEHENTKFQVSITIITFKYWNNFGIGLSVFKYALYLPSSLYAPIHCSFVWFLSAFSYYSTSVVCTDWVLLK